jgi:methionyl-tRNA synthetase
MAKRYYITTPIYYVNSVPHIGTALTTLASDVTARYQKMRGRDVTFLTGTDENGLKVMEAAQKAGEDPQAFVDRISQEFERIWSGLYIEFDDFIRTTEERHRKTCQRFFEILQERGFIYKGKYEGWYDVSTETFYKESDLVDGKSPDGNPVQWVEEENYFFKLSAFQDQLLEHIERNPKFILPEVRRNEVVSFIKQGLRDASISRSNPGWGIPVPGDEGKVIYVWFDALINYVAATGWPEPGWDELWPAEVEWMGKDILTRFHATLWPAMLLGVGLPLPETLVGHGWMLMGGEKISKSKGNVVAPLELAEQLAEKAGCSREVAVDAVRYYMAATMPFENDSMFTHEDFEKRYNSDLANDLGNALNRSLAMAHKFVGGRIPAGEAESEAKEAIAKAVRAFDEAMAEFRIDRAAGAALDLVRFLNKYIDTRAPWALAKSGDPALHAVLRSMLLCLRAAEGLVRPILPKASDAIAAQLNLGATHSWDAIGSEDTLPAAGELQQPKPIFPRIDVKKAAAEAALQQDPSRKQQDPSRNQDPSQKQESSRKQESSQGEQASNGGPVTKPGEAPKKEEVAELSEIGIEEFMKVQLKVGRVLEVEPVDKSDKLLKLQVLIGEERRQIVAGIRKNYDPMDLVGRQVIVVANLKPAKLRGVESQGMLLAAVDAEGGAILLQPDTEAPDGAQVR